MSRRAHANSAVTLISATVLPTRSTIQESWLNAMRGGQPARLGDVNEQKDACIIRIFLCGCRANCCSSFVIADSSFTVVECSGSGYCQRSNKTKKKKAINYG